jgi:hypothetical protein
MSIAFDPVRSFLWVLDTAGLHAVFPDGTVSTVRLTGSLPASPARLGVGLDGTLYATGQAAIVSLRPAG